MTREQAAQLVAILVGHYPNAKFTRENAQVWTDTLQELDAERSHEAVKKLVRTEKWMPSLAHIFELVNPPKRELAAPYHELFPPEQAGPRLPAKLLQLAAKPMPRAARAAHAPDVGKARMLLEDAEAKGELTEEQIVELANLKIQWRM